MLADYDTKVVIVNNETINLYRYKLAIENQWQNIKVIRREGHPVIFRLTSMYELYMKIANFNPSKSFYDTLVKTFQGFQISSNLVGQIIRKQNYYYHHRY